MPAREPFVLPARLARCHRGRRPDPRSGEPSPPPQRSARPRPISRPSRPDGRRRRSPCGSGRRAPVALPSWNSRGSPAPRRERVRRLLTAAGAREIADCFVGAPAFAALRTGTLGALAQFHREIPMDHGAALDQVARMLALPETVTAAVLKDLAGAGEVAQAGTLWRRADFDPARNETETVRRLEHSFRKAGLNPPDEAEAIGRDIRRRDALNYLIGSGTIVRAVDRVQRRAVASIGRRSRAHGRASSMPFPRRGCRDRLPGARGGGRPRHLSKILDPASGASRRHGLHPAGRRQADHRLAGEAGGRGSESLPGHRPGSARSRCSRRGRPRCRAWGGTPGGRSPWARRTSGPARSGRRSWPPVPSTMAPARPRAAKPGRSSSPWSRAALDRAGEADSRAADRMISLVVHAGASTSWIKDPTGRPGSCDPVARSLTHARLALLAAAGAAIALHLQDAVGGVKPARLSVLPRPLSPPRARWSRRCAAGPADQEHHVLAGPLRWAQGTKALRLRLRWTSPAPSRKSRAR